MCGIFVAINKRSGSVPQSAIDQALSALTHRGPDEQRSVSFENVCLGFARLSIVDEAGGSQPLFNEDRSLMLVCNGEIYNYRELRSSLQSRGHNFATNSDAEVILHLYEENNESFVEALDGMFAFVLVDMKKKAVLWARDRLGIKPLLCFEDKDFILLSSEAKALFSSGLTRAALNRQAIHEFFTFNYIPGAQTVFENVFHVEPATLFQYELGTASTKQRSYWQPNFPAAKNQLVRVGPYAKKLRRVFEESVSSQMIGDRPVGGYLSGGIDSTVTSIILQQQFGKSHILDTFSIRFPGESCDESSFFEPTIKEFGFAGHIFDSPRYTVQDFARALKHIEQPQNSLLDCPMIGLSGLVRDAKIKVVLSGEGSDELFGGYFQYTLNQIRRALDMPVVAPMKDMLLDKVLTYYRITGDTRTHYLKLFNSNLAPIKARFGTFPAWYPVWAFHRDLANSFLVEPQHDPLGNEGGLAKISQALSSKYLKIDDFNKSLYLELKTRLPNYILHRSDRNSMANSVELRVPFLSNAMIDFALNLPAILKMYGLKEKYIVRKAFGSILPARVKKRMKFGYFAPATSLWDKPDAIVDQLMSESALAKNNFFKPAAVNELRKRRATLTPGEPRQIAESNLTAILSVQMLHEIFVNKTL